MKKLTELAQEQGSKAKKVALCAAVVLAVAGLTLLAGCGSEGSDEAESVEDASIITALEGDDWATYLPVVTTKEDGTQVQKTPYGGMIDGYFMPKGWDLYNTYVLDADNRGCTGCHALEDVLMATIDHWVYYGRYENESIRYDDCFGCHAAYYVSMQDFTNYIHTHMQRESFTNMGGTCTSCHYITDDGQYLIWDEVKYDVMRGITDVSASSMDVKVSWDQDEITPLDKMFIQRKAKFGWAFNIVEISDDIWDTYTITFSGAVDKPCELSIQQMIDMFGLETRIIKNHCSINGTGGPYIYQAEVTGIPVSKILEYIGVQGEGNLMEVIGIEGYDIPMYTQIYLDGDALLVVEMNGERLTQEQGYPVSIWVGGGLSGGMFTRYVSEIHFSYTDGGGGSWCNYYLGVYGDYVYPQTGEVMNTPNIGVLTAESGQIFKAGETIHLEGYADAFEEEIVKMEFSFDHGNTWVEIPVSGTDTERWVYWRMDISNLTNPGSYLLKLRATSVDADGVEHVNAKIPVFLINVQ